MNERPGGVYKRLRARLLEGRANETLATADEDALLDEMDAVWWSMSALEREDVERSLPEARRRAERKAAAPSHVLQAPVWQEVLASQGKLPPMSGVNHLSRQSLEGFVGPKPPEVRT